MLVNLPILPRTLYHLSSQITKELCENYTILLVSVILAGQEVITLALARVSESLPSRASIVAHWRAEVLAMF